jgi:hypothetical protein
MQWSSLPLTHAASRLKDREIAVPSKRRMKQISLRDEETQCARAQVLHRR